MFLRRSTLIFQHVFIFAVFRIIISELIRAYRPCQMNVKEMDAIKLK